MRDAAPASGVIAALTRAVAQLDDPVFLGVVGRSVLWAAAGFAAILAFVLWGAHHLLPEMPRWLAWLIDLLGTAAVAVLSVFLFLPVAAAIGTLFIDRVARAVEARFYPGLPQAQAAPLADQIRDAIALGVRVLLLSLAGLFLAILLPGIGAVLGWAISGWAIGRGLFVSVAMRRMGLREAEALHRQRRLTVLGVGGVLALAGFLPPLNLLIPVIGVAAMVHLFHADEPTSDGRVVPSEKAMLRNAPS